MTISKKEFENILRNTGIGDDRSAKVFFLGVDDGDGVMELEDLDYYLQSPIMDPGDVDNSLTTAGIAKILVRLKNPSSKDDWKRYRNDHLFQSGSDAILAYMFPIGRSTEEDWPVAYEKDFGLSSNAYYDFVLRDPAGRFKVQDS